MNQYRRGFIDCLLATIIFLLFLNASSQYGWWTDERSPANKLFVRLDGSNMHLAEDWVHPGTISMQNAIIANAAQAKIVHVTPALTASEQNTLSTERGNGAIFQAGGSTISFGHIEIDSDGLPYFYQWQIADATVSAGATDGFKVTIAGIPYSVRMVQ